MTTSDADAQPIETKPADPRERRGRWRRRGCGCAAIVGLVFLAAIGCVGVGFAILYWRDANKIAQAKAEASAEGFPLTLEEIDAFYPTSEETEKATRLWQAALDELQKAESDGSKPEDAWLVDSHEPLPDEELAAAREFLASRSAALEAAHAASENRAAGRFPIAFEDHFDAKLPHVQYLRGIANLFLVQMKVRLADGDAEGAVDDVVGVAVAAESLRNEPLLVSQLVRIAMLGVAGRMTEETLARAELDEAQLVRLEETSAPIDHFPSYRQAMGGERYMFATTFDRPLDDSTADLIWQWSGARGGDLAKGLEFYRPIDGIGEADFDEVAANWVAVEAEMNALIAKNGARYVMTALLFPAVAAAVHAFERSQAEILTARAAIACERYRLEQGAWPKELVDVVPKYLLEVPIDPFDDQPLRYVVDEEGPLFYSIGMNQTDDGGVDDPLKGDLTFRLLDAQRSPAETSQ